MKSLSRVRPSATPWTAAFQAPPSMGFLREEYWSGVPLPSPNKNHKSSANRTFQPYVVMLWAPVSGSQSSSSHFVLKTVIQTWLFILIWTMTLEVLGRGWGHWGTRGLLLGVHPLAWPVGMPVAVRVGFVDRRKSHRQKMQGLAIRIW